MLCVKVIVNNGIYMFLIYFSMSGDHVDESKLTGMSKYFNGNTMRGRANVSIHYHSITAIATDCLVLVESLSIIKIQ